MFMRFLLESLPDVHRDTDESNALSCQVLEQKKKKKKKRERQKKEGGSRNQQQNIIDNI